MKVHVVTCLNSKQYSDVLESFFRIRYDIYVREKKWMPENDEGIEKDQFDTDDATYLIGVEGDRVIAGSRFVPTSKPHLLSEVFGHLCTKEKICDPHVAEWTRGFILPEFRGGAGKPVMAEFCVAVMQWAIEEGVTGVGGIQEVFWLPLWRRFGWSFEATGEASEIAGDTCVPGFCAVSEIALANVRRRARIEHDNLVRSGPQKPFVETRVPELALA